MGSFLVVHVTRSSHGLDIPHGSAAAPGSITFVDRAMVPLVTQA